VNEWERHQEKLRGATRASPSKPVAADNEQDHHHTALTAAITAALTKVGNGAVAPVVIDPATGIEADSNGIGGTDDGG